MTNDIQRAVNDSERRILGRLHEQDLLVIEKFGELLSDFTKALNRRTDSYSELSNDIHKLSCDVAIIKDKLGDLSALEKDVENLGSLVAGDLEDSIMDTEADVSFIKKKVSSIEEILESRLDGEVEDKVEYVIEMAEKRHKEVSGELEVISGNVVALAEFLVPGCGDGSVIPSGCGLDFDGLALNPAISKGLSYSVSEGSELEQFFEAADAAQSKRKPLDIDGMD